MAIQDLVNFLNNTPETKYNYNYDYENTLILSLLIASPEEVRERNNRRDKEYAERINNMGNYGSPRISLNHKPYSYYTEYNRIFNSSIHF